MISMSGAFSVTFSVIFAYVADVTDERERSTAYGLVRAPVCVMIQATRKGPKCRQNRQTGKVQGFIDQIRNKSLQKHEAAKGQNPMLVHLRVDMVFNSSKDQTDNNQQVSMQLIFKKTSLILQDTQLCMSFQNACALKEDERPLEGAKYKGHT